MGAKRGETHLFSLFCVSAMVPAWHLKSPHFPSFWGSNSAKLTLRDCAVLWLYQQITASTLRIFKDKA